MYAIEELIPHRAPMVLLDGITDSGPEHLLGYMWVSADKAFLDAEGHFPAWAGIELLAQAIAAHAGLLAKAKHEAVNVGFLLGTRRYESECARFSAGSLLQVSIKCLSADPQGFAIFEGCIVSSEGSLNANINVFVPPNLTDFINGNNTGTASTNATQEA